MSAGERTAAALKAFTELILAKIAVLLSKALLLLVKVDLSS